MTSLAQLSSTLQTILSDVADQAAYRTGFVQRESQLGGAEFVQTLVFGWLDEPAATYEQLAQTATALDAPITAQGLAARFTPPAAECLKQVLAAAVQQVVAADSATLPLLQRFNGVYLQDSTTITLPDELAAVWPGCGGHPAQGHQAALKVQLQFEYGSGQVLHLDLQAGRTQDKRAPMQTTPLPAGALRLADLGYFTVAGMQRYDQQQVYTLSRYHPQVALFTPDGAVLDLPQRLARSGEPALDLTVTLSRAHAWPCRLIAIRMPDAVATERRRKAKAAARREGRCLTHAQWILLGWTVVVTNVPRALLAVPEALILLRLRWQIELIFKHWKSQGTVDAWRSRKPYRILCEVYAKLLGLLIEHWMHLACGWHYANRSLTKAAQTIRQHALALGEALGAAEQMCVILQAIERCLVKGARLNSRRKAPNTYQLLMRSENPY